MVCRGTVTRLLFVGGSDRARLELIHELSEQWSWTAVTECIRPAASLTSAFSAKLMTRSASAWESSATGNPRSESPLHVEVLVAIEFSTFFNGQTSGLCFLGHSGWVSQLAFSSTLQSVTWCVVCMQREQDLCFKSSSSFLF